MPNETRPRRLIPTREQAPSLALIVLIFFEHLLFGANRSDLALLAAIAQTALLVVLLLTGRRNRAALGALPLAWPGAAFLLVIAAAIFSLLPVGGRLGNPAWLYVAPQGGGISLDPLDTRIEIVKLFGLAAVFLTAAIIGSRREQADAFQKQLSYAALIYAGFALISWTSNPVEFFGLPRPYGGRRLAASFLSANTAATLFGCLSLLSFSSVLRVVRRLPRPLRSRRAIEKLNDLWLPLILFMLCAGCLLMTASRGGIIATLAGAAVLIGCTALVRGSERSAAAGVMSVVALAAAAGLVLFAIGGGQVAARFGSGNPLSDGRMDAYAAYWRLIAASPWFGYGLGAFSSYNFQAMTDATAVVLATLGAVHNVYLQWLLEGGIVGAAPMFACIAIILAGIIRGFGRRSRQRTVLIFCLAAATVFLVHGLLDFALEEPSMAAFFAALLGVGYGVSERP